MELNGIVFDKDGTLTDFHKTWMPAYRAAAALLAQWCHGEVTARELLRIGGYDENRRRCAPASVLACGSGREIAEVWGQRCKIEHQRVLRGIEQIFDEYAAANPVAAADLNTVFTALRNAGLTLGVATMDREYLAHQTLSALGVAEHFSFVCGYDSGFGEKPEPGMVLGFCAATGIDPSRVAVVGDTPHDLNMARAAKVHMAIGVLTGASGRELLLGLADKVVDSVADIEPLLG